MKFFIVNFYERDVATDELEAVVGFSEFFYSLDMALAFIRDTTLGPCIGDTRLEAVISEMEEVRSYDERQVRKMLEDGEKES